VSSLRPTSSQREAIEAGFGPALVLAGPGAGKTFCLIELIRFLIEWMGIPPARINAFTFTNKAAEEIGARLDDLGTSAQLVKRGTIHAFCAELLRQHGHHEGLERGFGIADENYQRLSPILMTALTAGLALIPLAVGGGEPGNELQTPMAIVILGGLLSATALNMVVLPALHWLYGDRTAPVDHARDADWLGYEATERVPAGVPA
jgi:hypothetical protein